jgi:hypothetical protein
MVTDKASSTVEIPVESTAVHHCNVVEGDAKNLSLLLRWATYCAIGIKTTGVKIDYDEDLDDFHYSRSSLVGSNQ